jgi:hypothetical protein
MYFTTIKMEQKKISKSQSGNISVKKISKQNKQKVMLLPSSLSPLIT